MRWLFELASFRFSTISPNQDETAVHGCNPALSVLVLASRKVFFSCIMISLAFSVIILAFIRVSVLLLYLVVCCIEPCHTKKIFVKPVEDKALINHVISTPTVTSEEVCKIHCFLEAKCESYNFGPKKDGGHMCELSDSDAIRDPLDWITKQGFLYAETEVRKFKQFTKTSYHWSKSISGTMLLYLSLWRAMTIPYG